MTENALEKMEDGGEVAMVAKKRIKFWAITLLLSIAVMSISLLIFCQTGKANHMEDSIAYVVVFTGKYFILQYAVLGAVLMCVGRDHPPGGVAPIKIGPGDRAVLEQAFVVLSCIVTLVSGKIVEILLYTMSFIIGFIAIAPPVDDHDDDFGMNHLWFTIGLGIVTGLVCLVPSLFFILGWFSIFILTYVLIIRFNFPEKSLVEACAYGIRGF